MPEGGGHGGGVQKRYGIGVAAVAADSGDLALAADEAAHAFDHPVKQQAQGVNLVDAVAAEGLLSANCSRASGRGFPPAAARGAAGVRPGGARARCGDSGGGGAGVKGDAGAGDRDTYEVGETREDEDHGWLAAAGRVGGGKACPPERRAEGDEGRPWREVGTEGARTQAWCGALSARGDRLRGACKERPGRPGRARVAGASPARRARRPPATWRRRAS